MTISTAQGRTADGDLREKEALSLCEEDLEVGRPFVHPETRLEYADFHAYLAGKDPVPHWRNAYIKGVHAGQDDRMQAGSPRTAFLSRAAFRAERVALIVRLYDRDGHPPRAARTDEHDLAFAAA